MRAFGVAVLVLALAAAASAFYLPGVAPRAYADGEPLPLLVNRLDSTEAIVPYDYYRFDFCEPGEEVGSMAKKHAGAKVSENLGQILLGERIRQSPYHLMMKRDMVCVPVCKPKVYKNADDADYKRIANIIKKDYMQHWILDNLPAVECIGHCNAHGPTERRLFRTGFPVGCHFGTANKAMTPCTETTVRNMHAGDTFLNNHIDFTILFHESPEFVGARIVGVEVRPRSIHHASVDDMKCGPEEPPQPFTFKKEKELQIIYSYTVLYQASEIRWASRWDTYLQSGETASIHWFSIFNSLIIALFLTGMTAAILMRTLHGDIARYNQAQGSEEAQEEFGWKLVHGDIFRAPSGGMLLSVCVGVGMQIFIMNVVTIVFACLGFLSPATRGGLMTSMVVLWVMLGSAAGYVSARLYKTFQGEQWKTNVLLTSFLFPGIVFCIFFVLNLVLWHLESSAAVPFGTLVALIALWFCVSVPLTFVGSYWGFKKAPIEAPVRTNPIPRQIPPQPVYTNPVLSVLVGGVLPFGCIFIQLFFILNSIWTHKFYYVFGFLLIVLIILVITTVESTILLCYFHLCSEDYHWWWRSFLTGGSAAIYLFAYALIFYFKRMEVEGYTNFLLYAGYTFIATMMFWLMTGMLGFMGCFFFVRAIYASVKVD